LHPDYFFGISIEELIFSILAKDTSNKGYNPRT
jgi:hypothetical protein